MVLRLGWAAGAHGENESTENLESFLNFPQALFGLIWVGVAKADGQLELIIQFPQRAKGDLQESELFDLTFTAAAFDNI